MKQTDRQRRPRVSGGYGYAESNRFARYRMTAEDFAGMLWLQDNACLVCGEQFDGIPHIDHDHACCPSGRTCGKCVRGILCGLCNRMLGLARDDPARLEAGARYLRAS